MRLTDGFLQALITISECRNEVPNDMRFMALLCLNDTIRSFYDTQDISDNDRRFIRGRILDMITEHHNTTIMFETCCSILDRLIAHDFPHNWRDLPSMAYEKLVACNQVDELFGSLSATQALVRALAIVGNEQRDSLDELVCKIFPMLEVLFKNQIENWGQNTTEILWIVMRCFLGVITIEIPDYFDPQKNPQSFEFWMNALEAIIARVLPSELTSKPHTWKDQFNLEKHLEWKLKRTAVQAVSVLAFHSRNRNKDVQMDPAAEVFCSNWAMRFLDKILKLVSDYNQGMYVSQKTMTFSLKVVNNCLSIDRCAVNMGEYLEQIMIDFCLPLLALNEKDNEFWQDDPAQYIYSENCKSDDHNMLKNAAEELIKKISEIKINKNSNPMIYNLVEFIVASLDTMENPRNKQKIDLLTKEYLLHAFQTTTDAFKFEKPIRAELEMFSEKYILPELMGDSDILKARCCSLYSRIGYFFQFKEFNNNMKICQGVSACLSSKCLPVKVAAAEAMCVLLRENLECRNIMRDKLSDILKYVLELLQKIDYEGTIQSLEAIIESYENDIGPHSDSILEGLGVAYYSYKSNINSAKENNPDGQDDIETETEKAASACLQTMKNLLSAKLSQETYSKCITPILNILNIAILENDDVDFHSILALLNLLVYKNEKIGDTLVFYFPILCYLILGKPNNSLNMDITTFPDQMQDVLQQVRRRADIADHVEVLTACLMNYFQKCDDIFLQVNDFYGTSFIDLTFMVVKQFGQVSLDSRYDYCLQYALKLLTGLLENFRGKIDNQLEKILGIVHELLQMSDRTNTMISWILSVISAAIVYNPVMTLTILNKSQPNHIVTWFEHVHLLTSEQEKERKLFALTEFLLADSSLLPSGFKMDALMDEIYKTSDKLIESKKYDLEDDEDYQESYGSEYSDLYDDEDDLWEEVSF